VPRLVLTLSDLFPSHFGEAARAALPRLPRLEEWLARGEMDRDSEGWRHWLQCATNDRALQRAPPASIAAAAVAEVAEAKAVWCATPVHWVAGLDTVRLHPAGVLLLSAEEQRTLARDFSRVFAGSGWSLHPTGRRELMLAGGSERDPAVLRTHDPVAWLGADPRAGLPAGVGATDLLRLGSEIEMWMHEHPVNLARQAQGKLSVSALWIWGGGAAPLVRGPGEAPAGSDGAVAWADDLFVDGLARLGHFAAQALPPRWPLTNRISRSSARDVLAVCGQGAQADAGALESLENDWIAPALQTWRTGSHHQATLLAGEVAVTLTRSPMQRLWRTFGRIRPWWESLSPC
jgi:hypothetical protein